MPKFPRTGKLTGKLRFSSQNASQNPNKFNVLRGNSRVGEPGIRNALNGNSNRITGNSREIAFATHAAANRKYR